MMKPAPIRLRIRAAEANARARRILRKVDEEDRLQRRVRWLAMKAVVSLREMRNVAAPKLESMNSGDRARWQARCDLLERSLMKIRRRGVG